MRREDGRGEAMREREPTGQVIAEKGWSIGDVSRACGVPVHTIRFWEKELSGYLAPPRTTGGQRRYTGSDIQRLREVRKLLWEYRFTIEGVAKLLAGRTTEDVVPPLLREVA